MSEKRPDPTHSVADEQAERAKKGYVEVKTPDVHVKAGKAVSPSEKESDKSWSRAGGENVEREVRGKR